MKRIHVLHVLNSAHGGSALSTLELIEELKHRGVRSSLVCFDNASSRQIERIEELVEGRVIFIPLYWMNKRIRSRWWKRPIIEAISLWRTWAGYRHQGKINRLIRENGVNLVHTSTILNCEGAIAARRNNLLHLWHVRELIGPDQHFRFYNYKLWTSFVSSHCRYLIANSSVTKGCLLQYFEERHIKTIPNGIRLEIFSQKHHTNATTLVVAMVGSVTTRWKNHEYFIRTAAALADRDDLDFRIYGSLPDSGDAYYRSLQELVQDLGLRDKLKFMSFARPEDIIREIDIMFHPTRFESFGRIFTEAMAGCIPIVAINEGGAKELIQDGVNGYLIYPDDVSLAAMRIRELAESPELRDAMGKNGRELAESKYTLTCLCDEMVSLYEEVLKERERGL